MKLEARPVNVIDDANELYYSISSNDDWNVYNIAIYYNRSSARSLFVGALRKHPVGQCALVLACCCDPCSDYMYLGCISCCKNGGTDSLM